MKKYAFLWSALLFICAACGNDRDEEPLPETSVSPSNWKVLEYRPAPGQFINERFDCQNMAEANAYAENCLKKKMVLSLGSFGGYIVVKAPKAIKDQPGYDFGISGNPFSGNSEPGIVWVSRDDNQNGKADDVWYELQGSDPVTRQYAVTYMRPSEKGDIPWKDNQGKSGVVKFMPDYHNQMYYPVWIKEDSYTLIGSMLPPRTVFEDNKWKNQAFEKGYVDNMGQDVAFNEYGRYHYNRFSLEDAVDGSGQPVSLSEIHFVKVQNAILNQVEIIGETSTEVTGFYLF